MKKIINLTPHDIVVIVGEEKKVFKASGNIARVKSVQKSLEPICSIPVVSSTFGDIDFGVEIQEDTVYIVSAMVLSVIKDKGIKGTFVSPNTGDAIRDEEGRIIGVPGFRI